MEADLFPFDGAGVAGQHTGNLQRRAHGGIEILQRTGNAVTDRAGLPG